MRKVTKYLIAAVTALGITGGIASGVAANSGSHKGDRMAKHGERMVKKVTKKLDLTDTQQVALKELQQTVQSKMQIMREGREQNKQAMLDLFGEQFDQQTALKLMQEKAAKMNANAPETVAAFANFYDSLDEQQQKKVVKFIEKRGGKRFGLMGFGRGHHKGHDDKHESDQG